MMYIVILILSLSIFILTLALCKAASKEDEFYNYLEEKNNNKQNSKL